MFSSGQDLTPAFLDDFKSFMRYNVILIPDTVPPKNGRFKLIKSSEHAALLQVSSNEPTVSGYHAKALPDNDNLYALPTQNQEPYYMFTPQLNGCQFISYGSDHQHVTVEHNNYVSSPNPSEQYRQHWEEVEQKIQQHGYKYSYHVSASDMDDIENFKYKPLHGINIVGEYTKASGWYFWIRDRVDQDTGNLHGPL